jgi:two-component system LytT family response regulator
MSTEMRVLIVDDEPIARQRLRRLLADVDAVQLLGECKNGREAVARISEDRPDLVFLDVQMPGMDGFGVVRALPPDALPIIVFVTAFDAHATAAFDVHALDYVVKPVEPQRFALAVERARRQVSMDSTIERHERLLALLREETRETLSRPTHHSAASTSGRSPKRLLINEDGRRFFISIDDVDSFEAYGNYVRIHVASRVHLFRATMAQVESSLDASRFARIHRSSIINLQSVREIQPWFSGEYVVILKDGRKLKLSRSYREQFQARGML